MSLVDACGRLTPEFSCDRAWLGSWARPERGARSSSAMIHSAAAPHRAPAAISAARARTSRATSSYGSAALAGNRTVPFSTS